MNTKICSKCGEEKPLDAFAKRYDPRRSPEARYPSCKRCVYLRRKANGTERRRSLLKGRRQGLEKRGFSVELYENLVKEQDNACAICHRPQEKFLDIDHNHKTGAIRALLCRRCNLGLGYFLDDPELLERAKSYLELHSNN